MAEIKIIQRQPFFVLGDFTPLLCEKTSIIPSKKSAIRVSLIRCNLGIDSSISFCYDAASQKILEG